MFPLEPSFLSSLIFFALKKSTKFSKNQRRKTGIATKKFIWVLFGVILIAAWVLRSATEGKAET
jgi:hypothetical protein